MKTLLYGNYQRRRSPTSSHYKKKGKENKIQAKAYKFAQENPNPRFLLLAVDPPLDLEEPPRTSRTGGENLVEKLCEDLCSLEKKP